MLKNIKHQKIKHEKHRQRLQFRSFCFQHFSSVCASLFIVDQQQQEYTQTGCSTYCVHCLHLTKEQTASPLSLLLIPFTVEKCLIRKSIQSCNNVSSFVCFLSPFCLSRCYETSSSISPCWPSSSSCSGASLKGKSLSSVTLLIWSCRNTASWRRYETCHLFLFPCICLKWRALVPEVSVVCLLSLCLLLGHKWHTVLHESFLTPSFWKQTFNIWLVTRCNNIQRYRELLNVLFLSKKYC